MVPRTLKKRGAIPGLSFTGSYRSGIPVPTKKDCLHSLIITLLVLIVLSLQVGINTDAQSFTKEELMKSYFDALSVNLASNWSRKYTSEPHLAGKNYKLAEWTEKKFAEYGFKTSIDTYDVYLSYPIDHNISLADEEGVIYNAPLKEDDLNVSTSEANIPTFLAYGANGNITAEYVYANYGTREDFSKLETNGLNVTGKIIIIRYGAIFRGLKIKFAQENGAIGVILYSDPGNDGGITPENGFEQYPNGPARQESSVERGSVQFLSDLPGDPTTPGYGSKHGVSRTDPLKSTPSILAIPMSYKEVKPILEKLNGCGLNPSILGNGWKGALPGYSYHTGPNKNYKITMFSNQSFEIAPIWNVYGVLEGINKNEVIILGNHRDAWIKGGAGDPNSGSAVMMEVARSLDKLVKIGWKPSRTIMLASWDGEEYGLLGSTEYGEFNSNWIKQNVIAYFNLDVAVVGKHFRLKASPVLKDVLRRSCEGIEYPEGGSLYDHFFKDAGAAIRELGSGSDYTVFLEHLGIPSADMRFTYGKGDLNIYHYHSNYDSYSWMEKIGDPGFVYHNVMSRYLGVLLLNMVDNSLVQFKLQDSGTDLLKFFSEVSHMVPQAWLNKTIHGNNIFKENGFFGLFSCQRQPTYKTLRELLVETHQEFVQIKDVLRRFDLYVSDLEYQKTGKNHSWWKKARLNYRIHQTNRKLKYYERKFILEEGLPGRSWYKHIVYASGRYTGYACQTLPALKESIEDQNFEQTVHWIETLRQAGNKVLEDIGT